MGNIIKSHNKKLINSCNHHAHPCNYRKKEDCPLEGKCRTENVIYNYKVSTSGQADEAYIGTAEADIKKKISVLSKIRHRWIKPP